MPVVARGETEQVCQIAGEDVDGWVVVDYRRRRSNKRMRKNNRPNNGNNKRRNNNVTSNTKSTVEVSTGEVKESASPVMRRTVQPSRLVTKRVSYAAAVDSRVIIRGGTDTEIDIEAEAAGLDPITIIGVDTDSEIDIETEPVRCLPEATDNDKLSQEIEILRAKLAEAVGQRVAVEAELADERRRRRMADGEREVALRELEQSDKCMKDIKDINELTMKTANLGKKMLSDELRKTRDEVNETGIELSQTRDELRKTRDEVNESEIELSQTKDELRKTRDEVNESGVELSQTRDELDQTRGELNRVIWERDELEVKLEKLTNFLRAKAAESKAANLEGANRLEPTESGGDEYETDEYDSDEYETDEHDSDEYETDEHDSDEYETDEHDSDEYETEELQVDELAAAKDIDVSETPLAVEAQVAHLYTSDDSSAFGTDAEETDAVEALFELYPGRQRLAIMPGDQPTHQPASTSPAEYTSSAYNCVVDEITSDGVTIDHLHRMEPETTLEQELLQSALMSLFTVGMYSLNGVPTPVPIVKTPWGTFETFQIVSFDEETWEIMGRVGSGYQFEILHPDDGPVVFWPTPMPSQWFTS